MRQLVLTLAALASSLFGQTEAHRWADYWADAYPRPDRVVRHEQGAKPTGLPGAVRSLDLVQSSGSLYQSPGYANGSALPGLGGLPALDRVGGVASNAGPLVIQLDGPATTALLRGEAVHAIVENPRAVQSATMSATRSNAGRRELTSLQLSPGTLTA